ncbi:hypothetical protein ABC383_02105 [Noviherbaspirillum sp. 1P10PC]|uniref:hypothetical protein n=1 Tax=Noviherbaspirillum sp. 1P10PC TaxID=3132292 RepID=UPI0039A107CB
MGTRTTRERLLDGIEENIVSTKKQIDMLKVKSSLLLSSGLQAERRKVLQQICMLQDTLELLEQRKAYASELVH